MRRTNRFSWQNRSFAQGQSPLNNGSSMGEFARNSSDEFSHQPGFAIYAYCQARDEAQAVLSKRSHCDSIPRNSPCAVSRKKRQPSAFADQLGRFFCTHDMVCIRNVDTLV